MEGLYISSIFGGAPFAQWNPSQYTADDIRKSRSVEQDADVILCLYREEYYDKETKDHSLEIIVSKIEMAKLDPST
jgi:hypothetical protein